MIEFVIKNKNKIIAAAVIAAILALTFVWGGNYAGYRGFKTDTETVKTTETPAPSKKPAAKTPKPEVTEPPAEESGSDDADDKPMSAEEKIEAAMELADEMYGDDSGGDSSDSGVVSADDGDIAERYIEEPETAVPPENSEAADNTVEDSECTLSVRCDTILDNISSLDSEKRELVPEDGVIFPEQSVVFYEGETVFDVLLREMKKNKIHFEFEKTPVYNSVYIEGINNLYEFDCGELSGWMYRVNGVFPNYGCSQFKLKDGDRVEVLYTCSLGADIGGLYTLEE